jgi:hypothetical protein
LIDDVSRRIQKLEIFEEGGACALRRSLNSDSKLHTTRGHGIVFSLAKTCQCGDHSS